MDIVRLDALDILMYINMAIVALTETLVSDIIPFFVTSD